MGRCERCGSFAINEHLHGRKPGRDLHLCDVCYWRKIAEKQSDPTRCKKCFQTHDKKDYCYRVVDIKENITNESSDG